MRENLPEPAMARGGPGVSKRVWYADEDQRLMELVRQLGTSSWTAIATQLGGGRNSKQCRERWHNHLDPDVKKGPWSPEEDATIIEQQKVFGNQWARIAEFLPGRTDMSVKNRWHTFVRSAQRKGSDTITRTTRYDAACLVT